jgi:predicted aspartyl protease
MRRRLCGVALALGAVLLDPLAGLSERTTDHEVRLERLTAPAPPEDAEHPRPRVHHASHDIPLSGGRTHLIVDGALNGTVSGPMLVDTGASYCVLTRETARKLGLGRRSSRIPAAQTRRFVARMTLARGQQAMPQRYVGTIRFVRASDSSVQKRMHV